MADLYKLTQSQQGNIEQINEEIRLDVALEENPFENTGTVTGIVTDQNDAPIAGVLVKILDKEHNPLYHTLTDANGNYTITGITPASELHLHAIKHG